MWYCDWHWRQGIFPARAVEAEGYDLVWLKTGGADTGDAVNGTRERFIDPTFLASAREVSMTSMIPGSYWYLTPGRPNAQMGLWYDLLLEAQTAMGRSSAKVRGWALKLDVEAKGLRHEDVATAVATFGDLTGDYPLIIYTNRTLWNRTLPVELRDAPSDVSGRSLTPYLEDAHWVAESVRTDPKTPFASQQAKAIKPDWWDLPYGDGTAKRYGYGGWDAANLLQFTDNALIAGKRQMAGLYRGTKAEFAATFTER
jgi:hypothetical protein